MKVRIQETIEFGKDEVQVLKKMAGLGGSTGFPSKNAGFRDPVKIPSSRMPGHQNVAVNSR